jgi:hypothetical protein
VTGEIIDIVPMRKEIKLRNTGYIHYVQSYITGGIVDNYHIDVVTENYLPRLLKQIDAETKRTVQLLRRHRNIIQGSIDNITTSVKRIKTPNVIRTRMEYRGPWGTGDPS